MTPPLYTLTVPEAARLKGERGIRLYRQPGEPFVGDPVEELFMEQLDSMNYCDEAIARGIRAAVAWRRTAAELAEEIREYLIRTRGTNGPTPTPQTHP